MAVPTTEPTSLPPAGVPRGWGGGLRSPNPPSSLEIKHNPNRPSRGAAAGGGGGFCRRGVPEAAPGHAEGGEAHAEKYTRTKRRYYTFLHINECSWKSRAGRSPPSPLPPAGQG